jgi:hypothetical protein
VREGAALLCYKAWPCVKSVAADCTLTIAAETPHPATIARARISSRGWRVLSQRRRRANRSGRGGGFSPSCDARGWESNATCHTGTHKLGTLDPDTMRIREYNLPAAGARPRRIALAPDGTVYYTDFARAYLGHFDPYGIAITSDGEVWWSESGVKPNTLVRFDPKSESFSTKPIPCRGSVVRNMVATPDRQLYLACRPAKPHESRSTSDKSELVTPLLDFGTT